MSHFSFQVPTVDQS